jgi:hypothetical protein
MARAASTITPLWSLTTGELAVQSWNGIATPHGSIISSIYPEVGSWYRLVRILSLHVYELVSRATQQWSSFISNDINTSDKSLNMVTLQRHVPTRGFHRELISHVEWSKSSSSSPPSCDVLFIERLNEGVFADTYQLQVICLSSPSFGAIMYDVE